ncbi:MAG TPA: aminotransferase class I/II-fold pyridoxal phosphate-dependent enzyme, partial [Clostridia bacterium]
MSIYELIRQYAQQNPLRFHTPGHKGMLDALDITELDLVGLGSTTSYISAAEKKTARFYNAKYTHYLISGTTSGILTLIAAIPKGGRIIVARASHKSIFNGCLLSGIEPIIVENEIKEDISMPLSPKLIEKAISANPD